MSTCICNVNWSVYNLGFDVIYTLNNSTSDMLTWFCVCDVFTWLSRGVGVNKCRIFCIRHFQMGPCCNPACSCIQGHSCPQWGVQGDEPCWLQGQISGPALLPTGFVSVSLFIYAYKRWEFVQEYKKIHVNIGTIVLLRYQFSFLAMKLPVSRSFADVTVTRGAVLLQHLCVSHRDNRVQWQGQWIPWCQLWGGRCVCGLSLHTPGVDQHTTKGIAPPMVRYCILGLIIKQSNWSLHGVLVFCQTGGLGHIHIPLLSDLTKQISRDYGVLLEGPGIALRWVHVYTFNSCSIFHCNLNFWSYWFAQSRIHSRAVSLTLIFLFSQQRCLKSNFSSRGLFLIDPSGVVKHMSINDLPVGRSVEETLRLVKAFQYVETHGEVCPASWTPESPTVSFYMSNCWDAVGMVISGTWACVRYVRSSCQGHWKLVLIPPRLCFAFRLNQLQKDPKSTSERSTEY